MHWLIYKLTSSSGKSYIGQTSGTLAGRWREHVKNAKAGRTNCPKLYNAIRAHGEDGFVLEPLCTTTTQANADYIEIQLIEENDAIKRGYNVTVGGGGNSRILCKRGHLLEETRDIRGRCRTCAYAAAAARRVANIEQVREYQRNYQRARHNNNLEESRKYKREQMRRLKAADREHYNAKKRQSAAVCRARVRADPVLDEQYRAKQAAKQRTRRAKQKTG